MRGFGIKKLFACILVAGATAGVWYGASHFRFSPEEIAAADAAQNMLNVIRETEAPADEAVPPPPEPDESDYEGRIAAGDFSVLADEPVNTLQMLSSVYQDVRGRSRYLKKDVTGDGTQELLWLVGTENTKAEAVIAAFVREKEAMRMILWDPETVDDYYRHGLIHNVADLYDIDVQQINGDGSREKSAQRIVNGIEASKRVPFERVVFALGIRFVGETSAKLLARHFKTMDALMNASLADLQEVEGIGEVMAKSIVGFFHNEANLEIVRRLRQYGLQMALTEEQLSTSSDKLAGKSIVISGVFAHHSRDEYKALIEQHGGKNVGSISGKTSFILAGDNMGPSKLQKAEKLGIPIMSEDEFLQLIS